jgi:FkbM family methyltransferase
MAKINWSRPSVAAWIGLARSLLMYYAIPGRAAGWRRLYRQFVSPGDLCFDVGAHVGNRTGALLAIGARVVAVEPQPLMANTLRRLYGSNPRFTLVGSAVASQSGKAEMLTSTRTPTVSTLSVEWTNQMKQTASFSDVQWDAKAPVEVTTLDALIAQFGNPVFCKLDIEGYEYEALNGLGRPIQTISFEYLPGAKDRSQACLERLTELGDYEFTLIKGEYPRFAIPNWISSTDLNRILSEIPANGRAGEVYAQLKDGR